MILPPVGYVAPTEIHIDGFDPFSRQITADGFLLSVPLLENLERNGPSQKYWDVLLVPETLTNPMVVLEGLKRANFEHGLCYCSVPLQRPSEAGSIEVPSQKVFCAYAIPSSSGFTYTVMDWDWREVGPTGTGIPYRWQRDFERIVWPTS
jgi:hypothetical protein